MGRRWPGKTGGAFGFALIPIAIGILWLLSFFQEKESNNASMQSNTLYKTFKKVVVKGGCGY